MTQGSTPGEAVCRGCWSLGSACGRCQRCRDTCHEAAAVIHELRARVSALEALPPKDGDALAAACTRLAEKLRRDENVQAVGAGDNELVVYTIRQTRTAYPSPWEGWPVRVRVTGRMVMLKGGG